MVPYTLVLVLGSVSAVAPGSAQTYGSLIEDMREREYVQVTTSVLAMAERMPAELYGFRPAPEIRNFGDELNHAADVNFRLCGLANGERNAGPPESPRPTDKSEIVARLRESLDRCGAALGGLTDGVALEPTFGRYVRGSHIVAMLGHMWASQGKLSIMMRLNGLAPPSG